MIADIYEAASVPDLWSPTLDRIARPIGLDGGCLISNPPNGAPNFVASEIFRPAISFLVENRWAVSNSITARTMALNYDGFVTDLDIFPDLNDYYNDPVYLVFGKRFDAGFGTGTNVLSPTGHNIGIRFARRLGGLPTQRATAQRLDLLRPHLARAALMAERWAKQRATTQVRTLEAMGMAAAALTRAGKLVVANANFEALSTLFSFAAFGRLRLNRTALDARFAEALAQLQAGEEIKSARSIPAPAHDGAPPLVIHLLPIWKQGRDVFGAADLLLIVTPLNRQLLLPIDLLRGLFDLTPAESTLTRNILAGDTLEAVAQKSGLAINTLRKRLKSVFAKTGAHRQADLVALLSGLPQLLDE